jgi:phosphate transport system substrate-binding protein
LRQPRRLAAAISVCASLGFVCAGLQTRAQSPSQTIPSQTLLTAAGATFPAPVYQKWFTSFAEKDENIRVRYDAVGSQEGIRRFSKGEVDFAATDMPLSDEKLAQIGRKAFHFATVLGAVVPVYNVSGLKEDLRFTPEILAGIYLGKITKWNDPQIRSVNHGAPLPDAEIAVFHRSDGSGTTFAWTDYLSKVSPQWRSAVGADVTVHWPVGNGAERNEGIAQGVRETPNSIGYVEFIFAIQHRLSFGLVRNAAGRFIQADLPSLTAAAAGTPAAMGSDFRFSITNAVGKDSYPIATFTWFLVPQQLDGAAKKTAMAELLRWVLSSGQKQCSALGYAPLPTDIAAQESRLVDSLQR